MYFCFKIENRAEILPKAIVLIRIFHYLILSVFYLYLKSFKTYEKKLQRYYFMLLDVYVNLALQDQHKLGKLSRKLVLNFYYLYTIFCIIRKLQLIYFFFPNSYEHKMYFELYNTEAEKPNL